MNKQIMKSWVWLSWAGVLAVPVGLAGDAAELVAAPSVHGDGWLRNQQSYD